METLEQMIERHEGKRNKAYSCSANHLTIGIGHNIDGKGLPQHIGDYFKEWGEITDSMIYELLYQDIADATKDCLSLFPAFKAFTLARQNALVDFLFNVGIGTARKFRKAIAAINADQWDMAAVEMKDSAWYVQVGDRAREICEMIKNG